MRAEDLFAAIGCVEESRLERSEGMVYTSEKEAKGMTRKPGKVLRTLLIAAVVVSMLAFTAYAVTGFLIFDSPEDMISAIFGDNTGFDHKGVTQWKDPQKPESVYDVPGFDRVPADETVIAKDIAPHVEFVGQSVSGSGFTLKVDAFVYDAATGCGFVTYLLENPDGHDYQLQENGEIWYRGKPDPVQVNQYGYPHIIQEKTTADCLAVTYYFRDTGLHGTNLVLSLPYEGETASAAELETLILELDRRIRETYTPEEAVKTARETIGEAIFEGGSRLPEGLDMTQEEWDAERAYTILRDLWYQETYEQKGPSITIPMEGTQLNHATAARGAVVISPISFQLDATDLREIFPEVWHDNRVNVVKLTLRFEDGTEYTALADHVDNTIFRLVDSATEGREDLYNRYTCMFNRLVDVQEIRSIVINGKELMPD